MQKTFDESGIHEQVIFIGDARTSEHFERIEDRVCKLKKGQHFMTIGDGKQKSLNEPSPYHKVCSRNVFKTGQTLTLEVYFCLLYTSRCV